MFENVENALKSCSRIIRIRRCKKSRKYNFVLAKDDSYRMKLARNLINDLEQHGPAGLVHIVALSSATGRSVRIWRNGMNKIIGESTDKDPLDVEYHGTQSEFIGHWTLPGNRDPAEGTFDLNQCLFSVIGAQINKSPHDLRLATIKKLKENITLLANRIEHIIWLKKYNTGALMLGGARYHGNSALAAAKILDKSQNARCYFCKSLGHPRGHASHPNVTGQSDSVENYSRTKGQMKTGFLSRHDQDFVANLVLTTKNAQIAMNRLNSGEISEIVTVDAIDLKRENITLPKAKEYYKGVGEPTEHDFRRVVIILRHHENEYKNENADVFVFTFYPII